MKIAVALLLLAVTSAAFAVSPQFWEENTQDAFAAGDPQSVSINSDGEILLAPQLKKVYEGSDAIIWKLLADGKGNLIAATGNEGRVVRIDSAGKSTVILDTKELEAQAILLDKNGNLYAATSPDGKIYLVKPDGTSSVFFDPEDKYIWSLAIDPEGNLYAGTGDHGKIYKIDPQGKGKVLVDTNQSNITVLAWDASHHLLAGSDRNGILYRIDSDGKAFVLYDSDMQQITAIYAAPDNSIYFSAVSAAPTFAPMGRPFPETTPQPAPQPTTQETPQPPGPEEPAEGVVTVEVSPVQPVLPPPQPRTAGASQLYRLTPDGLVETLYSSPEDQILDITGYKDNQVLVSTGKKSKLIAIDPDKKSTILLKSPEEQLTSLVNSNGKLRVASANPGNIYELVEVHAASGTHYSDVKDTRTTSTWGQIRWKADVPKGTTLTLSTRSGNTAAPDATWTAWRSVGSDPTGAGIQNSRARFIQWKADFSTTDPKLTPVLRGVSLAYLQQNLRPEIQSITVQPPGAVFRKAQSFSQDDFAGVREDAAPDKEPAVEQTTLMAPEISAPTLGKREYRRGFRTITWNATDANHDELRYDIFFRADNEKEWKPLGTNLKEPVFAWDTQTLPDGTYTVKIVANDSASNPKELSLSNSKESQPFEVDNTAPRIEVVKKSAEKGKLLLEVKATDQYSTIADMQYAIHPGEWVVVFPVDLINDSTAETYHIELDGTASGSIVLKCTDRVGNTATIRYALQ